MRRVLYCPIPISVPVEQFLGGCRGRAVGRGDG